jgi:hypothetical protein
MRRILDPMLSYFDMKKQWAPRHGLALLVLSDMAYLEKSSGILSTPKKFCVQKLNLSVNTKQHYVLFEISFKYLYMDFMKALFSLWY